MLVVLEKMIGMLPWWTTECGYEKGFSWDLVRDTWKMKGLWAMTQDLALAEVMGGWGILPILEEEGGALKALPVIEEVEEAWWVLMEEDLTLTTPQEVHCCKACNNSSISSSNSKVPKEEDPEEDPRVFEGLVEKVREEV
jgi:hypothetical protein